MLVQFPVWNFLLLSLSQQCSIPHPTWLSRADHLTLDCCFVRRTGWVSTEICLIVPIFDNPISPPPWMGWGMCPDRGHLVLGPHIRGDWSLDHISGWTSGPPTTGSKNKWQKCSSDLYFSSPQVIHLLFSCPYIQPSVLLSTWCAGSVCTWCVHVG